MDSSIIFMLLLQIFLIMLNAIFASAEIAVISMNDNKLARMSSEGDKRAQRLSRLIKEPARFLATIQVAITLAGFLGSAFAADNFSGILVEFLMKFNLPISQSVLDSLSVVFITLILSYVTLILGELVPKQVAMRKSEPIALGLSGTLNMVDKVFSPIVSFLTFSTNLVLRLMGIDPNAKDEQVSEEDILYMLDTGVDEGTLDKEDITYIKNVFKLNHLDAQHVMTHRKYVSSVSYHASKEEILNIISEEKYSRLPVYKDNLDNIVGILHAKDYLLSYQKENFNIDQTLMPAIFVPESMDLDVVLKEMQKHHNHMVIVVNEHGVPSGVITMEDIFEEIVGEIWDESDEESKNIEKINEDSYKVLCASSAQEFYSFFNIHPNEDSEATTVNGWLIEQIGSIPKVGTQINVLNIQVEVIEADGLMAKTIIVNLINKEINEVE